jgi:hypothetical protein
MSKFKVNDKVRAFGINGFVSSLDGAMKDREVKVVFDNFRVEYFSGDGRASEWHNEPSLELIDRPKRVTKKKLYIAVKHELDSASVYGGHMASLAYPERRLAEGQFISPNQIVEIEIDIEE